MYRILKQLKKDDKTNAIITVALVDSQNEVVEIENEVEALRFVEILNANSPNILYIAEKVG